MVANKATLHICETPHVNPPRLPSCNLRRVMAGNSYQRLFLCLQIHLQAFSTIESLSDDYKGHSNLPPARTHYGESNCIAWLRCLCDTFVPLQFMRHHCRAVAFLRDPCDGHLIFIQRQSFSSSSLLREISITFISLLVFAVNLLLRLAPPWRLHLRRRPLPRRQPKFFLLPTAPATSSSSQDV